MVQGIQRAEVTFNTATLFQAEGSKEKKPTDGKKGDSIESASTGSKETWGGLFYRIACCPFNSFVWVARKLACALTLGYCCNDAKVDPKDVANAAKEAIEKMNKKDAKEEDKKAAFDAFFKAHEVKAEVREFYIKDAVELSGHKEEDKQKPVMEKAGKGFDKNFEDKDVKVLEKAQKLFESKIEEKRDDKPTK